MASNNFTQKEMLVHMMNKLDKIENKLNETHAQALVTNGKVKLHTKLITGLSGALIAFFGWMISTLLK